MGFDAKKFLRTDWKARTETVSLPDLAAFFDGGKPEWVVRGLTGTELARCDEAAQAAQNLEALAAALAGRAKEKADALRQLLGLADPEQGDVPQDLAKRLEMLVLGSVEPPCDHELAVRLADAFPAEFYQLSNAVIKLTGQGKTWGKPSGSGGTPPSEPR